ncbi:putative bifunctional diguanylate cyclase/phosphodiesterase [Sphingomonas glaciei]|uniref:EAL domain-containing protein n=1 Tax=Sphingomonas glaciei TaxID=2938948 RepID=A0ABY5MZ75_9SPHN|nr:EAL domain-containing protein [Sphingomonas glaciei]UUR09101.1 EAL domain-containing protein [Sphingomonas glaciei]
MKVGTAQKISNMVLSGLAGVASFVFSLYVFVTITQLPQQITAAVVAGGFCLVVCYIAAERPNSAGARALAALRDRLLAVEEGDLTSPAPEAVRRAMPKVAAAVDTLFAEVRSSIDNAQALGMYDPVTSLPNRLNFRAEAERLLAKSENRTPAMLFVDLDRFKAVNDSLGHARGDQLLVMVANRLRVLINSEAVGAARRPLLARLAGDEFTLFFPDVAGETEAERIARRVVLAIGEPFELHGHSIDVGASVGLALGPRHGRSVEELMRAADIAMYRAKSRGGHGHCLFSDSLAAEHQHRIDTEKALADAVERGEFRLVLQPQLSLVSGAVTGAEALLRWKHPLRGMVPPNQFISIAEQTGIISEIGEWVMAEVAAMLASWSETQEGPKRVAFNVSPRQLERQDFFPKLRQIFAEAGVGLDRIEIEITESTAMECSQATLAEMADIRRDGATIALDDFGTGYSNIARLRQLPLDRVKLDQSLIHDITTSEQARNVVQAVIQLVRGVDCELVAEAVETVAQADILRTMGCETIQGFVFAQPMLEQEFLAWTSHAVSEDRSAA